MNVVPAEAGTHAEPPNSDAFMDPGLRRGDDQSTLSSVTGKSRTRFPVA
jgi:hypothetical protein